MFASRQVAVPTLMVEVVVVAPRQAPCMEAADTDDSGGDPAMRPLSADRPWGKEGTTRASRSNRSASP